MSAIMYNFNRESICTTCLSQNVHLIAVRDSQACILSCADLHLKPTDRICWVCHDFVQRMVAFKSRAQQAQAWLRNMAIEQQNRLVRECVLTNVGMMNTPYVTATDPLKLPDVKPEPDSINSEFHESNNKVPQSHQQNHSAIIPGSINTVIIKPEAEDVTTNLHQNMARYQQQNQNRVNTPGMLNHNNAVNCLQNITVPHSLQQSHSAIPGTINSEMMKSEPVDPKNPDNLHQNMASSFQLPQNLNRVGTPGASYSPMLMKFETDENNDNHIDEALNPCKLEQRHCEDYRPVVAMPLTKPKSESNANYNDNVEYGNMQNTVRSTSYQMENNLGAVTAKPLQIIKPGVENNISVTKGAHERNSNSVDTRVFSHQKEKAAATIKNKTAETPQPDYIYTETVLTEEEMTQWRSVKPRTEFYARGKPTQRCEKCIEPFHYRKGMRAHARSHTEAFGDLVCHICQQRTVDKKAMDIHTKWHYRLLKCRYCPFMWDDVNSMRRHCQEAHSIPQVLWDCDRCDHQFPTLQMWRRHSRNHKVRKTAKCPICGQLFGALSLKTHVKYHTGEIVPKTCPDCGKQCRGDGSLKSHMLTHATEVDKAAYCVECNFQCRNQKSYQAHLKGSRHLSISKEQYRFECHDCGKKCATKQHMRRHADVHSDTKYPCEKCRLVFNTVGSRSAHIKRVHMHIRTPKREYICDQCGKVYTTKLHLLEHINTHTGARPYVCKLCGDTFAYVSALYLHGRFKHKIQKKNNTNRVDTKKIKGAKSKKKKVNTG